MKKTLFSLMLIILFSSAGKSQIFVMPRGGLSYSNVSFSDEIKRQNTQNSRYNLGYTFGALINIPIAGPFSLQPEVNFAQKGYKLRNEEFNTNTESTQDLSIYLNYIEVPILGSLQFGDQNVQAIINFGPYVAYGLGGKAKFKAELKDLNTPANSESTVTERTIKFGTEPENNPDNIIYIDNAFDLGFQAGLGVGISAGPGFIVYEQRFGMGLLNLRDKSETNVGDVRSQNRFIYATLGYTIPFGGASGEDNTDNGGSGGGEKLFKDMRKRRR
jgi:hypothetical protein